MKAECQFAKVGQGLFYNGLLTENNSNFYFVYDCGTNSSNKIIEQSIEDYKQLMDKKLDLLVISHFHADHVSHIPKLLDNRQLGTVIIPFINKEFLLLLAAQDDRVVNNYELLELYSNPTQYFLEHGAERVIVVYGDGENHDFIDGKYEQRNKRDTDPDYNSSIKMEITGKNLPHRGSTAFTDSVSHYSENVKIVLPDLKWEFLFTNLYGSNLDRSFFAKLSSLLSKHNNSFDIILRDKKYIRDLRKLYKDCIGKDINYSSLIMLSGPLSSESYLQKNDFPMCHKHALCKYHYLDLKFSAYTLMLGDLYIDNKLIKYFDKLLKSSNLFASIIQLPHHGAAPKTSEFSKSFLGLLHRADRRKITYVASYGIKNTYGHPSVFWNNIIFLNPAWELIYVNERQDFNYTITF